MFKCSGTTKGILKKLAIWSFSCWSLSFPVSCCISLVNSRGPTKNMFYEHACPAPARPHHPPVRPTRPPAPPFRTLGAGPGLGPGPRFRSRTRPRIRSMTKLKILLQESMEFRLKLLHMGRYVLISKLDGALWLTNRFLG